MAAPAGIKGETIRSRPCPRCPVCGGGGEVFARGLQDAFFHAPGEWDSKRCLNSDCRAVWLDPMPLEEDIHIAYRGYLISRQKFADSRDRVSGLYRRVRRGYWANRYGYTDSVALTDRALGWIACLQPAWKGALDANVFYLDARTEGRLLEIGCGAGKQLELIEGLGWQAEGVDADPVVVAAARRKGLTVKQGYVYEQGYADNSFDAIILNHVIEHVYELDRFLAELHRILKPGGRLVVLTPNIESMGTKLYRHYLLSFMDTPRHLYMFTGDALRHLGRKAGFGAMRIFTTPRHAGYFYMSDKAIDRTGYFMIPASPPLRDRIIAQLVFLYEAAVTRFRKLAGEELVFIAEKQR